MCTASATWPRGHAMPLSEKYHRDQTLCVLHLCQLTFINNHVYSTPLVSTVLGRKLEWGRGVYWQKMEPKALPGTQTSVQLHTTFSSSHTVSVGAELAMYAYCHSPWRTSEHLSQERVSEGDIRIASGSVQGPLVGQVLWEVPTGSRNQNTPLWISPQTLCLPS